MVLPEQTPTAGISERDVRSDSGALRRGFAVLELLREATHPMTSREIANVLDLSDSTAHRLLQSLCDAGYVLRDSARRYFVAGKALLPLTIYHPVNVLRRDAFGPLRVLRDEYGVTASIILFVGGDRLLLDVLGVTGMLAPYYETRLDNPLHVSAAGKLLLLSWSVDDREAALGAAPYVQLTSKTITSKAHLVKNLETAAATGFATNIDENFIGFSAVAAPLLVGADKAIGCLALAGPTEKFNPSRIEEMGLSLRNSAQLIASGSQSTRAVQAMFGTAR